MPDPFAVKSARVDGATVSVRVLEALPLKNYSVNLRWIDVQKRGGRAGEQHLDPAQRGGYVPASVDGERGGGGWTKIRFPQA